MKIALFGRGKVGRALHARAVERGIDATLFASGEAPTVTDVDLVVTAVPDLAIAETWARLDPAFDPAIPFVHCAGTMPATTTLPSGRPTGAMHPVVSFARPHETEVAGRTFTVRGSDAVVQAASHLTRALGAVPLPIDDAGPAYHAASAIAANGAVALVQIAVEILVELGIEARGASVMMAGLLHSVADNVEALGVPAALTGPIARGDVEVVRMHRDALHGEAREAYDAVSRLILRAAKARGLGDVAARAIDELLSR